MEKIALYFLLFIIYSFLGWLLEVVRVSFKNKRLVNRGFLIGPYCPIYGVSALVMIIYLSRYKDDILTVFLLSVIISTFTEYLISYIMEKIFNARWWDYSNKKFNINGRVCLTNAFGFGILGTLLIYYINDFMLLFINKINTKVIITISFILFIIFLIDFIISMNISYKIKNSIQKLRKDNTEEEKKKIREILESTALIRRIFKAFPKLKFNFIKEKAVTYKRNIENKIEKMRKND